MRGSMRQLWKTIQYNIKRVMEVDPAATSVIMVLWTYPHMTALFWHFFAHRLYKRGWCILARRIALHARRVTGIEIHPGATIGRGLFIDHGMGVVIGETAIVGDDVTLFHGVTLGGMSSKRVKRHPTIEDNVLIGTGTKILGDITIGARTKIGCNLVIKHDIPADMIIFETDPENMYVRKPQSGTIEPNQLERAEHESSLASKKKENCIEYYI